MKWSVFLVIGVLAASLLPSANGAGCPEDRYADYGAFYVDDDPNPYIYVESNGIDGLQRGNDGNLDGHCAHPNPDHWLL